MATTAVLTARLEAIDNALTSGVLSTSFTTPEGGTQTVTYRSMAEMRSARDELRRQLGITTTRPKPGRLVWG